MEMWFSDEHTDNVKLSIRVDKQLFSAQSEFQRIDVLESKEFGKILVADGDLMLTEKDEFIYHEMMAHVPMAVHPKVENVLPIGGLREKSMAAYREGMKTVLIPKDNVPDLYEVDDEVKKNLTFLPMSDLAQVLNAALLKPKSVSARHPHPAKKAKPVEAAIPPTPEKPKPGAVC